MSKERLEVIYRTVTAVYDTKTKKIIGVNLRIDDYNWFIEQAKRVQELEEKLNAKIALINKGDEEFRYIEQERAIGLEEQNERYHEAIDIVLKTMATPYWHEMKDAIVNTLLRALESDER